MDVTVRAARGKRPRSGGGEAELGWSGCGDKIKTQTRAGAGDGVAPQVAGQRAPVIGGAAAAPAVGRPESRLPPRNRPDSPRRHPPRL
jgi:hypothetical protein